MSQKNRRGRANNGTQLRTFTKRYGTQLLLGLQTISAQLRRGLYK